MTEQAEDPASERKQSCVKLTLAGGHRWEWEREFVHIACVGSNAEFSAAVDRMAQRASLKMVLQHMLEPTNEADSHSGHLPKSTASRSRDETGK